jgi:histidinol-phosphate aminotransferase
MLRVRPSLLYYRRDSYVVRGHGAGGPLEEPAPAARPDGLEIIDCASGFVTFGTARVVESALRRIDPDMIARYPEATHEKLLKPALLARYQPANVGPRQLFLGHGSFNLIERVIHKLLQADEMLGIGPQFNEVPSEFQEAGGAYRAIPLDEAGYRLPVARLEAALAGHPVSILYLDNPNNPLGLHFDPADVERLALSCARHGTILLVDEAWGDYVADSDSAIHLVGRHPNVAVVRSFSKGLGLAGERVGYMFLSEPLAKYYREIDIPFEPGIVGATLARAVLDDRELLGEIRRETAWAKGEIAGAFRSAGLNVLPSHPSVAILSVEAPSRDIVRELLERGIRVLPGSSFARTHPRWDDGFCRVRIVERDLVAPLCRRIEGL